MFISVLPYSLFKKQNKPVLRFVVADFRESTKMFLIALLRAFLVERFIMHLFLSGVSVQFAIAEYGNAKLS
ncbi:hypothetical protein [uncultured Bacteroides sp.]|uniref:hypothetical protein n=1 Tax=uncultured Bacteroides sp. TaxID=162156 RepID=UPI002AAA7121|nr:hypothetical protein [uncultured Bacteroides sp.]